MASTMPAVAHVSRCAVRTHSSRIHDPTETPPQLMPPTKLPAKLSRRGLGSRFRGLFIDIGFAEAKESWRPDPPFWPYWFPLIIAEVLESSTPVLKRTAVFVSWEDGEEEAFREGVAMSMGDVVVIVNRVRSLTAVQNDLWSCGETMRVVIYEYRSEERLQ